MTESLSPAFFNSLEESFFTQYGRLLSVSSTKKNTNTAFKDHTQFPILVDMLSRKNNHHVMVHMNFSPTLYHYFFDAFLLYLTEETIPFYLRDATAIHFQI